MISLAALKRVWVLQAGARSDKAWTESLDTNASSDDLCDSVRVWEMMMMIDLSSCPHPWKLTKKAMYIVQLYMQELCPKVLHALGEQVMPEM